MATAIGKMGEFDINIETWESYTERLTQYFIANEIGDEIIGPKTYVLLKNLCAPDKPSTKSYEDLLTILRNHLSPQPSEITKRYRFHTRDQRNGESVSEFIAELRRLSLHCNFEDTLDKTNRDRLVCGLKVENIQKRLLAETHLTLDKAVKIAVAMETASRDANELQHKRGQERVNVNKVGAGHNKRTKEPTSRYPTSTSSPIKCYRCGGSHKADKCHHINTKCNFCSKTGHLEKVCLSKKREKNVRYSKRAHVKYVEKNDSDNEPMYHFMSNVNHMSADPLTITPIISGKPLQMELDTGSAVSIISLSTLEKHANKGSYKMNATNIRLKTYSSEQIRPLEYVRVTVKINDQSEKLDLVVVAQDGPTLFGRD